MATLHLVWCRCIKRNTPRDDIEYYFLLDFSLYHSVWNLKLWRELSATQEDWSTKTKLFYRNSMRIYVILICISHTSKCGYNSRSIFWILSCNDINSRWKLSFEYISVGITFRNISKDTSQPLLSHFISKVHNETREFSNSPFFKTFSVTW